MARQKLKATTLEQLLVNFLTPLDSLLIALDYVGMIDNYSKEGLSAYIEEMKEITLTKIKNYETLITTYQQQRHHDNVKNLMNQYLCGKVAIITAKTLRRI